MQRLKTLALGMFVLATPLADAEEVLEEVALEEEGVRRATTLEVVEVSAPSINCKFDSDCTVAPRDTSAQFTLSTTSGQGQLQTRTWPPGESGTAGEGLHAYLYKLKLARVSGAECVRALAIPFDRLAEVDYDDSGRRDHVFVVTGGAPGDVKVSRAFYLSDVLMVEFERPVCPGEDTYFFGVASDMPPESVTAVAVDTTRRFIDLGARSSGGTEIPRPAPAFLRADANGSGDLDMADAIFTLSYLFSRGEEPGCMDAVDSNDDGSIDLSDALYLLGILFSGASAPDSFWRCTSDGTEDALTCERPSLCEGLVRAVEVETDGLELAERRE